MAGSPEFFDFTCQKMARVPEKNSSFSHKCSLLSQYLKEKGSFGDLSLGMTCNNNNNYGGDANNNNNIHGNENGTPEMLKQTTTMDLFPVNEKQADVCHRNLGSTGSRNNNLRSMGLFHQQSGFNEDLQNWADSISSVNKPVKTESQNGAQLTIFYAGQVIVFNDFPADKAKEIMLLASQGNSLNGFPSVPVKNHPVFPPKPSTVESKTSIPSTSNAAAPNFGNNLIQERMQPPPQTIASDLPIARRASLHRFLEKRKDRITARAPYQINGPSAVPSKPAAVDGKSWLGLASQSSQ